MTRGKVTVCPLLLIGIFLLAALAPPSPRLAYSRYDLAGQAAEVRVEQLRISSSVLVRIFIKRRW
jgi:hypothetical protein